MAAPAAAQWPDGPLYLGFDLSTQSCKALVVDADLTPLGNSRVHFDTDLPHYGTVDGVHRAGEGHVTSPTLMWVEAVELAVERLKAQGCPLERICSISGSGQQHGSVYWRKSGVEALRGLDPSKGSAAAQLREAFVVDASPVWMDTSTTESCRELSALAGGALAVAEMTGSTAQERFSGHFFRRFIAERGLADVGALSLVSSFGASLLAGDIAPIDVSDAAGMNLMDIRSRQWHEKLLAFVAPGQEDALRGVLAQPQAASAVGSVHSYWANKYGFSPSCMVALWSGDNPCAVVGSGLVAPGDIAISLGTSDTVLSVLPKVPDEPLPFGHLFPHPVLQGCYWSMLCYANGDVTRRKVRDAFFGGADWGGFSAAIRETPVGNGGAVGLFYTTDEITPAVACGPDYRSVQGRAVEAFEDPRQNARAVVEMRALSVRNHLERLMPGLVAGVPGAQLLLAGGASANADVAQVFADVFQRPVRSTDAECAALGAAALALLAARPEEEARIFARLRALSVVRAAPGAAVEGAAVEGARAALAELEAKALAERGRMMM